MKYYIPDWEDRLDSKFDFQTDTFSRSRRQARDSDVYAHELFDRPPYDGIVVSLASFERKRRLVEKKNGQIFLGRCRSVKEYFRTASAKCPPLLMGDCGAFEYVNEKIPPPEFNTGRVARLYERLGFDSGVSVDHMVVDQIYRKNRDGQIAPVTLSDREKEARRLLSLENAKDFWRYHRGRQLSFVPVGAAQGLDAESYADSVRQLLDIGYRYIGLGTLVPKSDEEILDILRAAQKEVVRLPKAQRLQVQLHLFGVLRVERLREFRQLGVTSFDSASYLRKSWLRSGMNYLSTDLEWFAAVRVPFSENPKLVNNARRDGLEKIDLRQKERECLDLLRGYDARKVSLKRVLQAVLDYDQLLLRDYDGNHHEVKYERTLRTRPWEACTCPVCRELGIEVVIFRGANRNKRRGFHNTFIFYEKILHARKQK